ncbi:MAG TPA: hypothetical protein VNT01_10220 [Symbiobacteriaceae bacterium]|nr:hypothetical protein [Symbiobacteriaceae bacterium]
MPKRREKPYEPGETYYSTLAKDGSDSVIADLLNQDPANASQVVREAMLLYAAIQKGEVPPMLVSQWRRWVKAELARGVADVVLDELVARNLVVAGGVTPTVQDEVREVVRDRFAETAQEEEL